MTSYLLFPNKSATQPIFIHVNTVKMLGKDVALILLISDLKKLKADFRPLFTFL